MISVLLSCDEDQMPRHMLIISNWVATIIRLIEPIASGDKRSYFQPMIKYVKAKDRLGFFFERPTERIHLPDPAESYITRHEAR
jgi:hypothetical protein